MINRPCSMGEILNDKDYTGYFVFCRILDRDSGWYATEYEILKVFERKSDAYALMDRVIEDKNPNDYVIIPVIDEDGFFSLDIDINSDGKIVKVDELVTHIEWYKMFKSIYNVA